jgi:hypothetical protein
MRVFAGLVALHMINLSIDTRDARPWDVPEDLSINDQETIIEFILETVLGFDNIIAEHDDPDQDNDSSMGVSKVQLFVTEKINLFIADVELKSRKTTYNNFYYSQFIGDPTSPPPKA